MEDTIDPEDIERVIKEVSWYIVKIDGIEKGSDQVCYFVQKALMDQNFIPQNLPDRNDGKPEREVLYEDEELGFCICGHV